MATQFSGNIEVPAGTIANICQIFREVTGAEAEPNRDKAVIVHWVKRGWGAREFRLIIEYQFSDPRQKDFYAKPGHMNLRMMLNPAAGDLLIDIVNDLKRREEIQLKRKSAAPLSTQHMMLMKCGSKIPVGAVDEYSAHLDVCFERKGKCFF